MTVAGIKRVYFIATDPDRLGGVSSFITVLGTELHRRGYAITLLGVEQPRGNHPMPRPGDWESIVLFPTDEELDADPSLDKMEQAREKLRQILADLSADTVLICSHVWPMEILLKSGLRPRDRGGPVTIGQYHWSYRASAAGRDLKRILKSFVDVDKFLCLTDADADLYREAGLNNVTAMPNPVDIDVDPLPDRSKTVISLGRYNPEKSLDYLLRAWSMITSRFPEWRLKLYGAGPKEGQLRSLITELQIDDTAALEGVTSDVSSVLADARINAMSSQEEGLPIAIVEASMAGVPTVTFDCAPGIRTLVDDGKTGIIVPQNDTEALAMALSELMGDDARREAMAKSARSSAQQYRPDLVADRWEQLFEEAVR